MAIIDKYIGKTIGQYKILDKCNNKSIDGHSLYNAECLKCGYIKYDSRIVWLKEENKNCLHYDWNINWYSSRLHRIFNDMKARCYNENEKSYVFYGVKGIKICEEWLNNPQNFNDWSINNGYENNLTIDRIDSDKNYCPENCRWITAEINSKYKSTTNMIEVNGIINSGRGWSNKLGFGPNYMNTYIRKNGYEKCVDLIQSLLR